MKQNEIDPQKIIAAVRAQKVQKSETQRWYAVVHAFSRFDEKVRKVSLDLPIELPIEVVTALCGAAGYFSVKSALEELKTYNETHDSTELQFYYEAKEVMRSGSGGYCSGEEWNVGFGLSPEDAKSNYILSETGQQEVEGEKW
jgi:hypothetical protein